MRGAGKSDGVFPITLNVRMNNRKVRQNEVTHQIGGLLRSSHCLTGKDYDDVFGDQQNFCWQVSLLPLSSIITMVSLIYIGLIVNNMFGDLVPF